MNLTAPLLPACLLALAAGPAFATTANAAEAAPGLGEMSQVVGALVVVLALIVALAYGAQRLKLGRVAGGRHLKLVETLPLGPRERLLLVEMGGERLLLGLSPGRIERLHVQADAGVFGATLAAATPAAATSPAELAP